MTISEHPNQLPEFKKYFADAAFSSLQWNDLPSGWIPKYKQAFAKFIGDLSTHTKHEVLDCTISKDKTAQEESGVENAVAGFVTSLLADQWEKYLGKRDKERGDCPKSCAELAM